MAIVRALKLSDQVAFWKRMLLVQDLRMIHRMIECGYLYSLLMDIYLCFSFWFFTLFPAHPPAGLKTRSDIAHDKASRHHDVITTLHDFVLC